MGIRKLLRKSAFVNSFKLDKRFLYVLLLDLAFILLIISMIPLYSFILRLNLDAMKPLDDSAKRIEGFMNGEIQLNAVLSNDFKLVTSSLRLFLTKMTAISIIFLLLVAFAAGFIKSLQWSRILKQKVNKKTYLTSSLMMLIWNLLWILLFLMIVFGFKFRLNSIVIVVIIELILYFYFSLVAYPIFFRTKSILKTIRETFFLGTVKFYLFIQSFLAVLLILFILSGIIALLLFVWGPSLLPLAVSSVLFLIYFVWIKFYMSLAIERVY